MTFLETAVTQCYCETIKFVESLRTPSQPARHSRRAAMPRRARIAPTPEPEETPILPGGTRGGAKDASERVKAQAVIIFYKKMVAMGEGAKKMVAYAFAAEKTNNSQISVQKWVSLENDLGMDGLESRRPSLAPNVHRRRPKTLVELWDAIKEAWDEDLTPAKLECAYRLLTPVMGLINDKNGGNNFILPHTGLRKAMREDGWEI